MQIKPYSNSESKKNQIAKMFDNIAHRYDFLNRFLSLGIDVYWRKRALRKIEQRPVAQLLDVATGTADVAIAAARTIKPGKITGIDISREMLAYGQKKIENLNLEEVISLEQGDAENLPYADNTFDAITVAFGVRNFENLEKGLAEMLRVLKSGGKIVILEFSRPQMFPFKQLFNFYFKNILPWIGKFTSRDPKAYKYLYESVQSFPEGSEFVKILSNTGYKSSECTALTLGICSIYTGSK